MMRSQSFLARMDLAAAKPLAYLSFALVSCAILSCSAHGANVFVDGDDGMGNAPAVFNAIDAGSFDTGDGGTAALRQGWNGVRLNGLEVVAGQLTNRNTGGFGTDPVQGDNYIRLDTDNVNARPDVPDEFVVGYLPGQYNVFQFDLAFDQLPPEDPAQPSSGLIHPSLRARAFLQGSTTYGVNYLTNSQLQALKDANDTSFHTYTIEYETEDSVWGAVQDILRIDPLDGLNSTFVNEVLGTKFTIDNIVLARTTTTQAFPAIQPVKPNLIRNGDLSDTSNVVLSGDNNGAFDINGGNGNYGPFRGSSGDVDHWTPYNNNPNGIVEAVNGPDGTALNLLNLAGDRQGSFYLDTHYSVNTERFSLNSAGGYLNGLTQTDILNGVTLDATATYDFSFDVDYLDRFSNPDSTLTVALTIGSNETDANSAGAIPVFESTLDLIIAGEQTVSISGAALKAAQDSGQPVNLIVQSLADTPINNFPGGTPVPDDHVDSDVFTQVQLDNFSLVRNFTIPTGDVNKDGAVTQADVALAQDYLAGNGGETAEKRQNDLLALPTAPLASEVLASLNLTDFDLTGNNFFDQADVDAISALVTTGPGDFDGDGDVDGADFLGWQRTDPSQIAVWQSNYGTMSSVAANGAVPEPTSIVLAGLALSAIGISVRRHN